MHVYKYTNTLNATVLAFVMSAILLMASVATDDVSKISSFKNSKISQFLVNISFSHCLLAFFASIPSLWRL